jgi:radical SAM superfamily enzyme YgiQ (UPF0313 family)
LKITFIKPNMCSREDQNYVPSDRMEPLTVAILAGLTPPDVELKFFDDRMEDISYDEPTDLVAISVETFTARRAYQISSEYRRRGVPVVLGGFHPTLLPGEAMEQADSVVAGEAEVSWPQVVEDLRHKRLKKFYGSQGRPPLAGVKANRDIYKGKRYLPVTLTQFSRGCRYSCNFCCVSAFYRHTVNHRPVREVVAEIETMGKGTIFFVDDNIAADTAKAIELFEALVPLKIRWVSQISLSFASDEKLLRLMKKSGCVGVLIGFESLDRASLAQMNKKWNAGYGSYESIVRKVRDHGLIIYGTFVFGYDNDTPDTINEALNFATKQRLFIANFNHLMPYPGTPLYEELMREGRLLYDRWWLDPSYRFGHAVFSPVRMSPGELTRACLRARLEFNCCGSIMKRAVDFRANCKNITNAANYFIYNYISRREIMKKQDMYLGLGPSSG